MINGLVSVIVPCYNVKEYIAECIDSLIRQTYKNVEIILVDDGSTDETGQICADYASRYSQIVLMSKKNGGQSSARNLGIKIANGEYICFVDSDDYVKEDFISCLVDNIKLTNADIAICSFDVIDDEGNLIRSRYKEQKMIDKVLSRKEALDALFLQNITCHMWNKIFKKELFSDIKFPEGRRYEDIAIAYRLFQCADYVSVFKNKLYFYRNRSSSTTNNYIVKDVEDILFIVAETKKNFMNQEILPDGLNEFYCGLLSNAYIIGVRCGANQQELNRIRSMFLVEFHDIKINRIFKNPYFIKFILLKLNLTRKIVMIKMWCEK